MTHQTIIVTGATSGVGRAGAEALAGLGHTVHLLGRTEAKVTAAVEEIRSSAGHDRVTPLICDLGDYDQVRQAASAWLARGEPLHGLWNNAGLINLGRQTNAPGHEQTIAVNHLGPFLLTMLLLERLKQSAPARIVWTSSGAHTYKAMDLGDLHHERAYGTAKVYGRSKLANILCSNALARRLEGTGVSSSAYHPGGVGSGFATNNGWLGRWAMWALKPVMLTTAQGADTGVWLLTDEGVAGETGKYWTKRKAKAPKHCSEAVEEGLWALSEELVGLR